MDTATKIRAARVLSLAVRSARALVGKPAVVRCRRGGFEWELDLREGIDLSIFLFGSFEPEVTATFGSLIPNGGVVLDIGANIGAHTMLLAQLVGASGSVYAFEPTDYAFAKLNRNLALNPAVATRVHALQVLLTATAAAGKPRGVWASWPLVTGADLHGVHQGALKSVAGADAWTLDDIVRRHALTRVDLVKLDVDGNELFVLQGGHECLRKYRPPIVMEFAPYLYAEFGYSPDALADHVRALGYRCERLPQRAPTDFAQLTTAAGARGSVNVLLVPA